MSEGTLYFPTKTEFSNEVTFISRPLGPLGDFNVLTVSKGGNDAKGSRSGYPFLTIQAAVDAAQSGDVLRVLPGTYNQSIILKNNIGMISLSAQHTIIARSTADITGNTDLLRVGTGNRVDNFSLQLTSSTHGVMKGIVLLGDAAATSRLRNIAIRIDLSSSATTGSSTIYGVHSPGTSAATYDSQCIRSSSVMVTGAGTGPTFACYVDGANNLFMRDVNLIAISAGGGGTTVGARTNNAGAYLRLRNATVQGTTNDILPTAGTLEIGSTVDLVNANAGNLPFTTSQMPNVVIFGGAGAAGAGLKFCTLGGVGTYNTIEQVLRVTKKCIVIGFSVRVEIGPGSTRTDTFTLRRNKADTTVIASLTGAATEATATPFSLGFNTGDLISVKLVASTSTTLSTVVVQLDIF
jgi:hypothetical protein